MGEIGNQLNKITTGFAELGRQFVDGVKTYYENNRIYEFSSKEMNQILAKAGDRFEEELGNSWDARFTRTDEGKIKGRVNIWNGENFYELECTKNKCDLAKLEYEENPRVKIAHAGCGGGTDNSGEPIEVKIDVGSFDLHRSVIAAGKDHTCAINEEGAVLCWGSNVQGKLGIDSHDEGPFEPRKVKNLSNIVSLALGDSHTCALDEGGQLFCFGWGATGQLGIDIGDKPVRFVPTEVTGLGKVTQVAASNDATCAIDKYENLFCWGDNGFGQLGDGGRTYTYGSDTPQLVEKLEEKNVKNVELGQADACAIVEGGEVYCWGPKIHGTFIGEDYPLLEPTKVENLQNISILAVGASHICASDNYEMWCWGHNDYGQLGDSTVNENSTYTNDPTQVYYVGADKIKAIEAGDLHTCALDEGGTVWCWGSNSYGQLGDNTLADRTLPTRVIGIPGDIVSISAGSAYTCAVDDQGVANCWGRNDLGQLGTGADVDSDPIPSEVVY